MRWLYLDNGLVVTLVCGHFQLLFGTSMPMTGLRLFLSHEIGSPLPTLANAGSMPTQLFGLMENEVQRSRATARALSNQRRRQSIAPLAQCFCLLATGTALKHFLTCMLLTYNARVGHAQLDSQCF